ncbi:hypothetical protein Val02_77990 [Virgisporangium aliadipatigenens]|uniref:ABC3 transporter permease C-terminal domain-containing protein n=1 Tax=Virgisporangium aliadipatigenens TaxID=741659 RepID=A0A8J3YUS9_9ACTN|nr:ABC transporter permease [Virgisporangium aliadipatigenens]GIJ50913.1 hypothetical protein Val02_77990 [Virgisporangium aliadipatigenens]
MRLAIATVRRRWAGLAGLFVALSLGIALLSAACTVYASGLPAVPERYASADAVVRAPFVEDESGYPVYRHWRFEEARHLADRLAAVPGVTDAVPDPLFYAQPVLGGVPQDLGDAATEYGRAWSSAALGGYRLASGTAPAAEREAVVSTDTGLAAGTRVSVLTAAGPVEWTVTGTVEAPGVYVPDAVAARLAGGVRVIGLRVTPSFDASAVAGLVGEADVLTGDRRSRLEPEHEARLRWIGAQLVIALTGLAAFTTVFVVASTFALNVTQRRREIGLLRAVGATPGQVRRTLLGEAFGVWVPATVTGLLLGLPLAYALAALMRAGGIERHDFAVRLLAWPFGLAAGIGLAVALAGVWLAARRGSRVPPLDALRDAAVDRRPMTRTRWAAGLLCVAGGVAIVLSAAALPEDETTTIVLYSAMLLIVGATLLAPVLVGPVVRVVTRPFVGTRGATGLLVREGTRTAVRRVASTAAPVLVTVGFTALFVGQVDMILDASGRANAADVRAAAVVVPAEGTPGLSDAAVAAAGGGASLLSTTAVATPAGAQPVAADVAGADAATLARVGRPAGLAADEILVAGGVEGPGWPVGATVEFSFRDGATVSLRVAAVLDDAPAPVLLRRDVVRAHDPNALTSIVYVPDAGARATPGARVLTPLEYGRSVDAREGELVRIFLALLLTVGTGYTGIAIANTLLMSAAGRRREYAVLRLSGASVGQVLRVVAAEAVIVVGIGGALGLAVAAAALQGMRTGIAEEVGFTPPLSVPWGAVAAVVAVSLVLAVPASVIPAWRAGRAG